MFGAGDFEGGIPKTAQDRTREAAPKAAGALFGLTPSTTSRENKDVTGGITRAHSAL